MLNVCFAKYNFIMCCVGAFIVQYIVFKGSTSLTDLEFGTVITFTPVYLCFFLLGVVLFVRCLWSVFFLVYVMLYLSFILTFSHFLCGFVVMG